MKTVLIMSAALIIAGCSDHTRHAKRAGSRDSVSVPIAAEQEFVQDGNYEQQFACWRDHRIERNEVTDLYDYARGFQEGHTGPPGLVDGSADFNLGHSDGMQARMRILPDRPDADAGD